MLLRDEVQMLRLVPLFAGVDPGKLRLLAFTSQRVSFDPGEVLFHQGDPGDAAYVILDGNADILTASDKGLIKVAEVSRNAIVGEVAILCDGTRTATVRAVAPVEALRIDKEQFLKLMSDNPMITIEVMRVLATRLTITTTELTLARSQLKPN